MPPRSVGKSLLDRLVAQFWHYNAPFQCVLMDGNPRCGCRVVRNMPRGSDGGTWRTLRADKEEKDEAYRDRCADGDAPCDLPIRHGGSKGLGVVTKRPNQFMPG
jgi:hypothetical protein